MNNSWLPSGIKWHFGNHEFANDAIIQRTGGSGVEPLTPGLQGERQTVHHGHPYLTVCFLFKCLSELSICNIASHELNTSENEFCNWEILMNVFLWELCISEETPNDIHQPVCAVDDRSICHIPRHQIEFYRLQQLYCTINYVLPFFPSYRLQTITPVCYSFYQNVTQSKNK